MTWLVPPNLDTKKWKKEDMRHCFNHHATNNVKLTQRINYGDVLGCHFVVYFDYYANKKGKKWATPTLAFWKFWTLLKTLKMKNVEQMFSIGKNMVHFQSLQLIQIHFACVHECDTIQCVITCIHPEMNFSKSQIKNKENRATSFFS